MMKTIGGHVPSRARARFRSCTKAARGRLAGPLVVHAAGIVRLSAGTAAPCDARTRPPTRPGRSPRAHPPPPTPSDDSWSCAPRTTWGGSGGVLFVSWNTASHGAGGAADARC